MKFKYAFILMSAISSCKSTAPKDTSTQESTVNPFKPRLNISPFSIKSMTIINNSQVNLDGLSVTLRAQCMRLMDPTAGDAKEKVTKDAELDVQLNSSSKPSGTNAIFSLALNDPLNVEAISTSLGTTCGANLIIKNGAGDLSFTNILVASDTILPFSSGNSQIVKNLENSTLTFSIVRKQSECFLDALFKNSSGTILNPVNHNLHRVPCPNP